MVKRLLIACVLIACIALLGCATADPAAGLNSLSKDEIKAYNNNPNNTDKIICRNENVIGSRISRRTCSKESIAKGRARKDRQAVEEIQERDRILNP
ncbi:MAG: hypothetical protein V3S89_02850 [Desulfobacterales bacterium]